MRVTSFEVARLKGSLSCALNPLRARSLSYARNPLLSLSLSLSLSRHYILIKVLPKHLKYV